MRRSPVSSCCEQTDSIFRLSALYDPARSPLAILGSALPAAVLRRGAHDAERDAAARVACLAALRADTLHAMTALENDVSLRALRRELRRLTRRCG